MIAVYMMASHRHGTLYIGVTSDLPSRVAQHKDGTLGGFTKRYGVKRLVWFEPHDFINVAIQREKSGVAVPEHGHVPIGLTASGWQASRID